MRSGRFPTTWSPNFDRDEGDLELMSIEMSDFQTLISILNHQSISQTQSQLSVKLPIDIGDLLFELSRNTE